MPRLGSLACKLTIVDPFKSGECLETLHCTAKLIWQSVYTVLAVRLVVTSLKEVVVCSVCSVCTHGHEPLTGLHLYAVGCEVA